MKAYKAWDEEGYDSGSTIVFAENIREAKKIAMSTDACSEADFINIRVKRFKELDALYKGEPHFQRIRSLSVRNHRHPLRFQY